MTDTDSRSHTLVSLLLPSPLPLPTPQSTLAAATLYTRHVRPSGSEVNVPVHVHVQSPRHARVLRALLG